MHDRIVSEWKTIHQNLHFDERLLGAYLVHYSVVGFQICPIIDNELALSKTKKTLPQSDTQYS